ncbi:MAG: DUF1223 domain-containing protein [Kangiellaceae bacterium]
MNELKNKTSSLLLIYLLFLLNPVASFAQDQSKIFSSGVAKVPLIELYTSEGCSSCPPADEWLSQLKNDTRLWQQFVPIAFHVDYWDYIGWKDPFAKRTHALRQRRYRSEGNIKGVYTPGFVYMGQEFRAWYLHEKLPDINWSDIGNLSVSIKNNQAKIQFNPVDNSNNLENNKLKAHLSILGFDLSSKIKRGENEGKILKHEFVSLENKQSISRRKANQYQWEIDIPEKFHKSNKKLGVAVWVSATDNQQPIQSAGAWLN